MVAIVAAAVVVTIAATMDAVAVAATKKEAISIYYGLQTENKIQERIKTVCSPFLYISDNGKGISFSSIP